MHRRERDPSADRPGSRLKLVECDGCGGKWRASRTVLKRGLPLCGNSECPDHGEPMHDRRCDELGGFNGFTEDRNEVQVLEYRRIRRDRYCDQCTRHHDRGALMHYEETSTGDGYKRAYFCLDPACDPSTNLDYDAKPGTAPTYSRIGAGIGTTMGGSL